MTELKVVLWSSTTKNTTLAPKSSRCVFKETGFIRCKCSYCSTRLQINANLVLANRVRVLSNKNEIFAVSDFYSKFASTVHHYEVLRDFNPLRLYHYKIYAVTLTWQCHLLYKMETFEIQ